ncbi:triosephosphate isomerase [Candidatus Woesearchaeota archaeon]|nr:triosephosphate isomerase [Candidatus Woesearchaeota archaeon]
MLVIINFKTYKEATGNNAVKLAKSFSKFRNVIVCAQASDIANTSNLLTTFAQHIDPVDVGMNTGSITAFAIKSAGARGTLLNHSEYRLSFEELKSCLSLAKKYKLRTVICAKDSEEVKRFAKLKPDFIAIEPKELIGGKISVTMASPWLITKSLKAAGRIPLLCGAGVHSKEDLLTAKKLGAKGVLIASAIIKNKNPAKKLKELLQ